MRVWGNSYLPAPMALLFRHKSVRRKCVLGDYSVNRERTATLKTKKHKSVRRTRLWLFCVI